MGNAWSVFIKGIARADGWCRPIAATRPSTGWPQRDGGDAVDGELVVAEVLAKARFGLPRARIVERLGRSTDPGAISLLAIASFDIPTEFSAAAIAEAEAAAPVGLAGRTDLRDLPLITIDGSDARDFDDAVWAEPDPDTSNPGGWHLVVAIADVAWYVRPSSALDQEAERRGNSVYFPDRVVPMLPEALSNDLCSLKPGVDRACMAVHLSIDAAGRKRGHRFTRALMRSAARLTYEEVQAIRDRQREPPEFVPPAAIEALYGAFAALARARATRGALELDLREDRVVLDADRRPVAVVPALRLDSHRLIEEFMILANVAAAEELEARHQPCMYRVHDAPDPAKIEVLRDFLEESGIPGLAFAKGQALKPELFNRLLRRAEGHSGGPARQRVGLALSGAGRIQPKQYRPFRAGIAALRTFHLADSALCRSFGSSRLDRGRQCGRQRFWRWRPASGHRSRANGGDRRADLSDRTARHSGRARSNRALPRRAARRCRRRRLFRADQRHRGFRVVRYPLGEWGQRACADLDASRRLLRSAREAAAPRRPALWPHFPSSELRLPCACWRRMRSAGGCCFAWSRRGGQCAACAAAARLITRPPHFTIAGSSSWIWAETGGSPIFFRGPLGYAQ